MNIPGMGPIQGPGNVIPNVNPKLPTPPAGNIRTVTNPVRKPGGAVHDARNAAETLNQKKTSITQVSLAGVKPTTLSKYFLEATKVSPFRGPLYNRKIFDLTSRTSRGIERMSADMSSLIKSTQSNVKRQDAMVSLAKKSADLNKSSFAKLSVSANAINQLVKNSNNEAIKQRARDNEQKNFDPNDNPVYGQSVETNKLLKKIVESDEKLVGKEKDVKKGGIGGFFSGIVGGMGKFLTSLPLGIGHLLIGVGAAGLVALVWPMISKMLKPAFDFIKPELKALGNTLWENFVPPWLKTVVNGIQAVAKDPLKMIGGLLADTFGWLYDKFKFDFIDPIVNHVSQLGGFIVSKFPPFLGGDKNWKFKELDKDRVAPKGFKDRWLETTNQKRNSVTRSWDLPEPSFGKSIVEASTGVQSLNKYIIGNVNKYNEPIQRWSGINKVDPSVIKSIMAQENPWGDPTKKNPNSSAGGLMQLTDAAIKDLALRGGPGYENIDRYDKDQAIKGGTRLFSLYMNQFGGDVQKAITAYHAGPGTVTNLIKKHGDKYFENVNDPSLMTKNYGPAQAAETFDYVSKVYARSKDFAATPTSDQSIPKKIAATSAQIGANTANLVNWQYGDKNSLMTELLTSSANSSKSTAESLKRMEQSKPASTIVTDGNSKK